MQIEDSTVIEQSAIKGGYNVIVFEAPGIAGSIFPGQFIHLRIPGLQDAVLRRPFSVYRSGGSELSILYKEVGKGTAAMKALEKGSVVSLMGPLGNGFPLDTGACTPVLVAGGYGVAPLSHLAGQLESMGMVFIGGRTADDVLCVDDFKRLGWDIHIATDDGSLGAKGVVTEILDSWLKERDDGVDPVFYACGPDGMLKAVGYIALAGGWQAWLSLDKHMGCGVGACLACVQKLRKEDGSEKWGRVCKDGPIFESREIVWG